MANKIAIFNQKGGVGKSTAAKSIAGELSKNHEKTVLLVDCDASANATLGIAHPDEPETYLAQMAIDWCEQDIEGDILDAICPSSFPRLDLIPANRTLMLNADKVMSRDAADFDVTHIFETLISSVEHQYDYILFDIGAGEGTNWCTNALMYCDSVLVPIEPGVDSIEGYKSVQAKIRSAKKVNRKLQTLGVFVNKFKKSVPRHKELLETAKTNLEELFIPVVIEYSEEIENARTVAMPICYYRPSSKPAKNYAELTEHIIDKIENKEA